MQENSTEAESKKKWPDILSCFLAVSLLAVGLFNEYLCCAASVFLSAYLLAVMMKRRKLVFTISPVFVTVLAVSVCYLLSIFLAVDRGMAFIGFLKILPLPLFIISFMQQGRPAEQILRTVPHTAALMTVISAAAKFVFPDNAVFSPAGRIAGTMQYPNTFALVLLVSLIVTASKDRLRVYDHIYLVLFAAGIILSGSKAVMLLSLICAAALVFTGKSRKLKLISGFVALSAACAALLYAVLTGNAGAAAGYISSFFSQSTFVGRLLYSADALPMLLEYPFGSGWLGYYYLQHGFQTGFYTVRFVHNDILQLDLDAGWIPALMLAGTAVHAFFRKEADAGKRILVFAVFSHCLFDMDLSFTAVFMVFILILVTPGKEKTIGTGILLRTMPGVSAAVSAYMCLALTAASFGGAAFSHSLYPWNTDVNTALMLSETDPALLDARADAIIAQNSRVAVAYSAKALCAFNSGDFAAMIRNKDKAIEKAPLVGGEYEDYMHLLLSACDIYMSLGDKKSADVCLNKARNVLADFRGISSRLSVLGRKIDTQPRTLVSAETEDMLRAHGIYDRGNDLS